MNYEKLYSIKAKLDRISSKLDILSHYCINTNKFSKQIKDYSNDLYKLENSNSIGSYAYQDETLINNLYNLVNNFDLFMDNLLKGLNIFETTNQIKNKIDRYNDDSILDNIIQIILNDLIYYKYLVELGLDDSKSDFYETLYKIIKKEFKSKGFSTIYNTLISMNIGSNQLKELIEKDIAKYKTNKYVKDKLDTLNGTDDYKNEDVILLTSLCDEKSLNNVINDFKNKNKEIKKLNKDIDRLNKLKQQKAKNEYDIKRTIRNNKLKIAKRIISGVLSFSIIIGSNIGLNSILKSKKDNYLTQYSYYDTIEGNKTDYDYSDKQIGKVYLKIYHETTGNNERQIDTYILDEIDGYSASDYVNLDLDEKDLISTVYQKDEEANSKTTNTFTEVKIPTMKDYTKSEYNESLLHVLLTLLIILADLAITSEYFFSELDQPTTLFNSLFEFNKTYILPIKRYLNDNLEQERFLNIKEDGYFSQEELDELNKKFKELEEKLEILKKKYPYISSNIKYETEEKRINENLKIRRLI